MHGYRGQPLQSPGCDKLDHLSLRIRLVYRRSDRRLDVEHAVYHSIDFACCYRVFRVPGTDAGVDDCEYGAFHMYKADNVMPRG